MGEDKHTEWKESWRDEHLKNTCRLPAGWKLKDLTSKSQSKPHNPDIARVFFWANMIENWGRGIIQMQKAV